MTLLVTSADSANDVGGGPRIAGPLMRKLLVNKSKPRKQHDRDIGARIGQVRLGLGHYPTTALSYSRVGICRLPKLNGRLQS
jgi:hypothetical protein